MDRQTEREMHPEVPAFFILLRGCLAIMLRNFTHLLRVSYFGTSGAAWCDCAGIGIG